VAQEQESTSKLKYPVAPGSCRIATIGRCVFVSRPTYPNGFDDALSRCGTGLAAPTCLSDPTGLAGPTCHGVPG
jgi:hypothetical protein